MITADDDINLQEAMQQWHRELMNAQPAGNGLAERREDAALRKYMEVFNATDDQASAHAAYFDYLKTHPI